MTSLMTHRLPVPHPCLVCDPQALCDPHSVCDPHVVLLVVTERCHGVTPSAASVNGSLSKTRQQRYRKESNIKSKIKQSHTRLGARGSRLIPVS